MPVSVDTFQERRYRLINALHELKSRICFVEQQHSYLRNDLSSTCDKAIVSLQGSPCLHDAAAATETISTIPPAPEINPLSLALDKTGAYIINGLDRMGDGIIYIILKIRRPLIKRT